MAKISPLDPLGLTVNPATGPETLGIAYVANNNVRFWGQKMNFDL